VKASVHQALMDSLGPQLYDPHLEQSELELRVRQTLQSVINSENTPLAAADRNRIAQEVADEILGLGPLEPLLRDGEITEIMVNGPNDIFVERSVR
jgi:pilus assembly protein CpaF